MFSWKKLGRVLDPASIPSSTWIREFAQAPSALVLDENVRVFFSSRTSPDSAGQYVSQLGYVDLDRKDLRCVKALAPNPVLPLGRLGTFDEFGIYPASVIRYGDEIRLYYAGWTRCESVPFNAAIGVAVSWDNGETFQRLGEGPVLGYSPDEPFVIGSPKIRRFKDMWYLWYVAGDKWLLTDTRSEPVYKIRMAYSSDGLNWTKVGKTLIPPVLSEEECQASPDVTFFRDKYHMFFSYRYALRFTQPTRGYRIGYACSDDLYNWVRLDGRAGLTTSGSGWDSESISYAHLVELDGKLYVLYQGNEIGRVGFGLAELDTYSGA